MLHALTLHTLRRAAFVVGDLYKLVVAALLLPTAWRLARPRSDGR